jgi:DNA processing protein
MDNWKKWPIKSIYKKDYPLQLKGVKNCPIKLFYRGNWDNDIFNNSLAIVGSRRMSRYGKDVIAKFMPSFVANNITIISGFMYGVDTESHQQCLEFGGKTVAVLGGGLDILAPPENEVLYTNILKNMGIVISEYESDFQPTLWSFPQRNRIVSGLSSLGVLVVEAGIKSGSLITARIAKEQGKNVIAVPGQINNSIAQGTNYLIKKSLAKMTTEVEDIIDNKQSIIQEVLFNSSDPLENDILNMLKIEPLSIDEICTKNNIGITMANSKVTMMTLNNLVFEENGKVFLKK